MRLVESGSQLFCTTCVAHGQGGGSQPWFPRAEVPGSPVGQVSGRRGAVEVIWIVPCCLLPLTLKMAVKNSNFWPEIFLRVETVLLVVRSALGAGFRVGSTTCIDLQGVGGAAGGGPLPVLFQAAFWPRFPPLPFTCDLFLLQAGAHLLPFLLTALQPGGSES